MDWQHNVGVVRLLVECRYLPDTAPSVNYMVKTPSLGSAVSGLGVFGVQLRIAKGTSSHIYTSNLFDKRFFHFTGLR